MKKEVYLMLDPKRIQMLFSVEFGPGIVIDTPSLYRIDSNGRDEVATMISSLQCNSVLILSRI